MGGVTPDVLIIGRGFLGEAAAAAFSRGGKRVLGLSRNAPEGVPALLPCDVTDPASMEALAPLVRGVPVAVHAVSSGKGGAETYAAVYREGLRNVIRLWNPGRILFVGSTSVYAQTDGSVVHEESPAVPDRETGRILLEAEALALQAGGSVARLSGIYGPGRSVLLRKFLSGEAVLEAGGGRWINQIHRDDAAEALVSLADPSTAPGIYNVSDDTPTTQGELYGWMAEVTGRPLPPEGPADLGRKRGWTSKKISNAKLRAAGWTPRYPSYRDALPQLLQESAGESWV
jgi:nucleoside-diphosphate-sugar epimerase